jgi:hypothetical protein
MLRKPVWFSREKCSARLEQRKFLVSETCSAGNGGIFAFYRETRHYRQFSMGLLPN